MNRIILKRRREKSLLNRHPWVFSGAISVVKGNPVAGETVVVTSAGGDFLGWGAYSPASQIRVRLWSFREQEQIDEDFFLRRIRQAHDLRAAVIKP
ncbi:MAG TPA: 23S rRNA (cytosine(1962)-C(5))-methyltransferase RlmI, partial [Caldithrix abyssi]|nr:23S rRNA (cytosine(1962)-C(5))-methyltransferase RlmI [Caldithrix abyssi]